MFADINIEEMRRLCVSEHAIKKSSVSRMIGFGGAIENAAMTFMIPSDSHWLVLVRFPIISNHFKSREELE
jgi:hypothetical protein